MPVGSWVNVCGRPGGFEKKEHQNPIACCLIPKSTSYQNPMIIRTQYQNLMTSFVTWLFILGTFQWEEGGNEICVTLKSIQNEMELTCYRFSWQFQPIRAVAVTESDPPRICSWVHTLSLIAGWPNPGKVQWFLKGLNPMQLSPKSLGWFFWYRHVCNTELKNPPHFWNPNFCRE